MRNVDVTIFKVTKAFNINKDAICNVNDIIMVDEEAYDGASAMNLTQGWGFCPFFEYSNVAKLGELKDLTWSLYMAYYTRKKPLPMMSTTQHIITA
jgi:hypothetical protein